MENSDYPRALGNATTAEEEACEPIPFPDPEYGHCTRVVAMVEEGNSQTVWTRARPRLGNDEEGCGSSSSDSDSNDSMESDSESDMEDVCEDDTNYLVILQGDEEALWLRRVLRRAIYGKVWAALVVRRRQQQTASYMDIWDVTGERCAVKEMLWFLIEKKFRHTEDPVKEVSAMQYLRRWHNGNNTAMQESLDTNVVMLRNALTDGTFLYVVTPYFEGGELFDSLIDESTWERHRYNEDEARYWMDHILNGIETLQRAGICHRDLSIENLMIHKGHSVVIDMGMCIRIPRTEQQQHHRFLIQPQGRCGKWRSMSPEIRRNIIPFDGYAADMWAVGTILFTMLVGFVSLDNEREQHFVENAFHHISSGRIHGVLPFLNERLNIHFSPELVSLLQDMFWLDPRRRLSLDQVRSHPWMNGPRKTP